MAPSTFGRSATDNARYDTTPNTAIPNISRLVAIGRRMKTSETFTVVLNSAYNIAINPAAKTATGTITPPESTALSWCSPR